MKTKFTFIKALIIVVISSIAITASAQAPAPLPTPTPFQGPSTPGNAPGATPVSHYICAGANVSLLSTPLGASQYVWWKYNPATSQWQVVAAGSSNTYLEQSTNPGFYTYEVQTVNLNGCESPISSPINVFALPPITPLITGPQNVCVAVPGNPVTFTLTASVKNDPGGYTYTYQWTKDGFDIPGATSSTYSPPAPGETIAGTYNYGVRISYSSALYNGSLCTGTSAPYPVTVTPLPATPVIQWN